MCGIVGYVRIAAGGTDLTGWTVKAGISWI